MSEEHRETVAVPIDNTRQSAINVRQHTQVLPMNINRNEPILIITQSQPENIVINNKKIVYDRARNVKILSCIDIVFLTLNLIFSLVEKNIFWIFFLLTPCCVSGYIGARQYKKWYIIAYTFYLIIMCFYYFGLIFVYRSLLFLVIFGVELFFAVYTYNLFNSMKNLNENELQELRDGWYPIEI